MPWVASHALANEEDPVIRLDLSKHALYERDEEIDTLRKLRARIHEQDAPTQVCLVSGVSGSGKSELCNQLAREVDQEESVLFITGKSDQYQDFSAPYSAIVQAFDRLGEKLLENVAGEKQRSGLIDRFEQSLSFEGNILTKLIPSFARLVRSEDGDREEPECVQLERRMELASERLAVAFRSFLRLLCTPSQPLVLFVDDLQWTDHNSLYILAAIVDDPQTTNFLFLGGYRLEEEGEIHLFLDKLRARTDHVTTISLCNLQLPSVTALIADVLCCDESEERLLELSRLLHEKTDGNPYYVLQFLAILIREDLLCCTDSTSQGWRWDMQQITAKTEQSDTVSYFVTKRIQKLPPNVRGMLIIAACLGFSVDTKLLEALDEMERNYRHERHTNVARRPSEVSEDLSSDVLLDKPPLRGSFIKHVELSNSGNVRFLEAIRKAEEEELVSCIGETCRFTHDRVQECFYKLINDGQKPMIHRRLGMYIQSLNDGREDQDHLLFVAADQCNRGSEAIEDDAERLELIRLNLRASKAARTKAGISLVSKFLEQGVTFVREDDWNGSAYDLVLEVYSSSADIESARGNFERSDGRVKAVLERARCPADTIPARTARALSLGARQEYALAIAEAKKALMLLGIVVSLSRARLYTEILMWRRRLKKWTDEKLLDIAPITDSHMVLAMKILQYGIIWGWNVDPLFGSCCGFAMLKITLNRKSVCSTSDDYRHVALDNGPLFIFPGPNSSILFFKRRYLLFKSMCIRRFRQSLGKFFERRKRGLSFWSISFGT